MGKEAGVKKIKKIIVGNWKMNPESADSAKKLVGDIKKRINKIKNTIVVICPPAIFYSDVKGRSPSKKMKFGVQNVHFEKSGAFTGEISINMAKSLKAEYVIIGHSERRAMGETDQMIGKKMATVVGTGITPILCIGEKEVDEHANYLEFLRDQLMKALVNIGPQDIEKIIIAYEPLYAIGKEEAVGSYVIHQRNIFIKKILTGIYGKVRAFNVPILYGGATTPDNAKEVVRGGSVDGLLVGHHSLRPENFADIIKKIESI